WRQRWRGRWTATGLSDTPPKGPQMLRQRDRPAEPRQTASRPRRGNETVPGLDRSALPAGYPTLETARPTALTDPCRPAWMLPDTRKTALPERCPHRERKGRRADAPDTLPTDDLGTR